jgi:hypothetical protein
VSAPVIVYTNLPKRMLVALLALGTAKVAFATDTYVPDQDAHDFFNDVTNEATGTGVAAGGVTLGTPVANIDTATNTVTFDADNVTGISVVARYGIIYIATGTSSTSPLLAYVDFSEGLGGNVTITGVDWDAAGIIPFVAAAA